jgi:hypothetical protein
MVTPPKLAGMKPTIEDVYVFSVTKKKFLYHFECEYQPELEFGFAKFTPDDLLDSDNGGLPPQG